MKLLLLVIALLLVGTVAGKGFLYARSEIESDDSDRIVVSEVDGLLPQTLAEEKVLFRSEFSFLLTITIDESSEKLYFADSFEFGKIFTCEIPCNKPEAFLLSNEDGDVSYTSLKIDEVNQKLYYAGGGGAGINAEIGRADLDGSNAEVLFLSAGNNPNNTINSVGALAVNPNADVLYVKSANRIISYDFTNTEPVVTILFDSASENSGHNLEFDPNTDLLYWTAQNGTTLTVYSYNTTGDENTVATEVTSVPTAGSNGILELDLDVTNSLLFFVSPSAEGETELYTCPLNAECTTPTKVADLPEFTEMVSYPASNELVLSRAEAIYTINYDGTDETEVINGNLDVSALDYLGDSIYWLDEDTIETVFLNGSDWTVLYKFGAAAGDSISATEDGIYVSRGGAIERYDWTEGSVSTVVPASACAMYLSADKNAAKLYYFDSCQEFLYECDLPTCEEPSILLQDDTIGAVSALNIAPQGDKLYWFNANGLNSYSISDAVTSAPGGAAIPSQPIAIVSDGAMGAQWLSPEVGGNGQLRLYSCSDPAACEPVPGFQFPASAQLNEQFSGNSIVATDTATFYGIGEVGEIYRAVGDADPALWYTATGPIFDMAPLGDDLVVSSGTGLLSLPMADANPTATTYPVAENTSPAKISTGAGTVVYYVDVTTRAVFECESLALCVDAEQKSLQGLLFSAIYAVPEDQRLYAVVQSPAGFAEIAIFDSVAWGDEFAVVTETGVNFFTYGDSITIDPTSTDNIYFGEPYAFRIGWASKNPEDEVYNTGIFGNSASTATGLDVSAEGIAYWTAGPVAKIFGKEVDAEAAVTSTDIMFFPSFGEERVVGGVLIESFFPTSSSSSSVEASDSKPVYKEAWFIAVMAILGVGIIVAIIVTIVCIKKRKKNYETL